MRTDSATLKLARVEKHAGNLDGKMSPIIPSPVNEKVNIQLLQHEATTLEKTHFQGV